MLPETKFLLFYTISLVLTGALLVWLDHRLHQRERE